MTKWRDFLRGAAQAFNWFPVSPPLDPRSDRQKLDDDMRAVLNDMKVAMEKVMISPRYANDCPQCVFLGHHDNFDLYYCPRGGVGSTVLARWSDRPDAYKSGMPLSHEGDLELTIARHAAIARGLMT
jgi:ribosomal protein S27AE